MKRSILFLFSPADAAAIAVGRRYTCSGTIFPSPHHVCAIIIIHSSLLLLIIIVVFFIFIFIIIIIWLWHFGTLAFEI